MSTMTNCQFGRVVADVQSDGRQEIHYRNSHVQQPLRNVEETPRLQHKSLPSHIVLALKKLKV